jgi:hypothetical protein
MSEGAQVAVARAALRTEKLLKARRHGSSGIRQPLAFVGLPLVFNLSCLCVYV